jgi:hypothetical protein
MATTTHVHILAVLCTYLEDPLPPVLGSRGIEVWESIAGHLANVHLTVLGRNHMQVTLQDVECAQQELFANVLQIFSKLL